MSRKQKLDRIKAEEQTAFLRKQEAFQRYASAKNNANEAHETMQKAWEKRCNAREEMNNHFAEMQASSMHYREVWDEYNRIRDRNNALIDSLRNDADSAHAEIQRSFDRASYEYQYGSKTMAPVYAGEGREYKARRDELNREISELCREVKEAKQNAEMRAPKTDSSAFKSAKARFEQAKTEHEVAEREFKKLKSRRDLLKTEFDSAQAEHKRLKEKFAHRLEEVKTKNQRERDQVLDKAGVSHFDRKDAKIVKKADGTTQIYHGGVGKGDGYGHGHTALDKFGDKTYERGAFKEHGKQNYVDHEYGAFDGKSAKIYPDRRPTHEGWKNVIYSDSGNFERGKEHGHIIVNEAGSVIYWRDQDHKHGSEYLIDAEKDDHTKI